MLDVYKEKTASEVCFGKYLLFLSWFPAIVQGPISRYSMLMPSLLNKKPFTFESVRDSMLLILIGLVKKMVIADRLGIFVNACFRNYLELRGVILYIAAVGYAFQLYTDFSGCVDICRGVSGLFGVNLVHNFNRPYLSRSIKEFWGKWHMSLSGWLKDYVYIPLGGNRRGVLRKHYNLMITFLISGLWHGAGFHFLLWGALHAIYQIIGQHTLPLRSWVKHKIGIEEGSLSERIYQTLITFNLVTFAWIFFRSKGLASGLRYVCYMISQADMHKLFDGTLYTFGVNQNYFGLLIVNICILLIAELTTNKQEDVIVGITKQHFLIRWTVYLMMIFEVLLFGVYGSGYDMSSFMYGGF
ncbi:MAG: MBOAT family protein [Oscillospiraceae bacterium]|nr:MBOAT family protein [Oscillospiraceae bacterium]